MHYVNLLGLILLFRIEILGLTPYKEGKHGALRSNRNIKECQHIRYGNLTHELFPSNKDSSSSGVNDVKYISTLVGGTKRRVTGHLIYINDPLLWLTVEEPGGQGGCTLDSRSTVKNTSTMNHCEVGMNAGFFDTKTGQCLGNIVISGKVVLDSGGIQNAHFGITRSGEIFTGYISEEEVLNATFSTLVGGVGWLLRRGEVFIDESIKFECDDTEETGTIKHFAEVISGRTAIGHDRTGRVVLAQIDGKTSQAGINLYEFAELLKSFNIINAINLDGGGSATMVLNQTVVNYPSDTQIHDSRILKERRVSTIMCVRSPFRSPEENDFHGHDLSDQHRSWIIIIISVAVIAFISIILNISFICMICRRNAVKYTPLRTNDSTYRMQSLSDSVQIFQINDGLDDNENDH